MTRDSQKPRGVIVLLQSVFFSETETKGEKMTGKIPQLNINPEEGIGLKEFLSEEFAQCFSEWLLPQILNFHKGYLSVQDAEDVVQETYAKSIRYFLGGGEKIHSLMFFRISARNISKDKIRKHECEKKNARIVQETILENRQHKFRDVLEEVSEADEKKNWRQFLRTFEKTLSGKQRRIFPLHAERIPLEKIARILDLPSGTVMSGTFCIHQKIREAGKELFK